jgi:hypothetical protein
MKKLLLLASITSFVLITSCNNGEESKEKTHQHDDGSTHAEHDTTKPVQQEFKVADTTKKDTTTHTHADGEKHSH